jgi:hypothetical protein
LLIPFRLKLIRKNGFRHFRFFIQRLNIVGRSMPEKHQIETGKKISSCPRAIYHRTPDMERLAKEGVRFFQLYAQSVCSSKRAGRKL